MMIYQRYKRVKFTLFRRTSAKFDLLLLRKRLGAAAATWAPQPSTCEQQRAAPRESALAHPDNSALQAGEIFSFSLHISRVLHHLLRKRRGRGNDLGTSTKYLRKTTTGAAEIGLGTTTKYLRGAVGIGLGTTTTKYLRGTANSGLGTMAKYLVNQNAGAGSNWAKAHIQYTNAWHEIR
jgi:hypothetical protein